jgi:hypothetical protein
LAKLDPPTSRGDPSAAAAHCQRQANGAAVLRLEIPGYHALTSALLTAKRICEPDALDRVKVEARMTGCS